MTELPRGTVTLLFTDVEGSTRLQHRMGEQYQEVVAEHRRLLEEAFAAHDGVVVDRQTESFFVAFARARHAVQAAAAAQQALAGHTWPDGVQVRVRMGIHSGDPELAGDRYVGLAVARAARICASAHGGQVLLSSSARALLSDHDRAGLRGLGLHRLKDFDEPEPISQLVVDGLPSQFPRLRTEARPSRRKWLLVAAAALVAVVTAVAAVALTRGGSSSVDVTPTSLVVVDPGSNKVVDAVDLGFQSRLIAAGEGYVWVVDADGSTLWRIDPRTREKRGIGIAVGAGAIPFGVAAGEGAVWVAVLRGERQVVLELGPEVGELRRTISYGGRSSTPYLDLLQPLTVGGGRVWAIDPGSGSVWRIDPHGGPAHEVAVGLNARALAAESGALWVAGSSGVTKLDAVTGDDLGSASIGSQAFAEVVSVALGGGATWLTSSAARTVAEIDPQAVAPRETFPVGHGPSGIAFGERGVWVANSGDGTLSRVDPGAARSLAIDLGNTPGGVVAAFGAIWTSPYVRRS